MTSQFTWNDQGVSVADGPQDSFLGEWMQKEYHAQWGTR